MTVYTVHQAKTNLSKLLERAEAGEDVIIARRDTPVAKLVPLDLGRPRPKFGALKGLVDLGDAFFEPLPEKELAAWEGKTLKPRAPKTTKRT